MQVKKDPHNSVLIRIMNQSTEFLTVKEVTDLLKVTKTTVHNWMRNGKISSFKFQGIVRIPKHTLLQALTNGDK